MKFIACHLVLLILFINVSAQSVPVPYTNNFDSPGDDLGWSHYAFYGNDDWEFGAPGKTYFNSAYSGSNAWVTKLTSNASSNSQSVLETPFFDLSDFSTNYCLSFYQKRDNSYNNNSYSLEYSFNGSTWMLLNPTTVYKSNWQTASGFASSNQNFYQYSSIRLTTLQGQDSVKFRFRFTAGSGNALEGWIIDDFSIAPEYINLYASQGNTIRGVTKYFSNITVKSNLNRVSPYQDMMAFTTSFYLSDDTLQDVGDILLGNVNVNTNSSLLNWSNTLPLPPNLSSGTHYIIYHFDSGNAINEQNDSDNSSYAILIIDSIYQTDYFDDLEGFPTKWNKPLSYNSTTWQLGDAESWHIEQPLSGENALIANTDANNNNVSDQIESPYLDLSQSTNSSLCFWYRQSIESYQPLTINLPGIGGNTTFPSFSGSGIIVPDTRRYGWDCFCASINAYDGEISTRFRIKSNTNEPLLVDDIYIGSSKPDAAIADLMNERFTEASETTMTLVYDLFNAGLEIMPSTNTEFYWSTDSLFDASDVLLTTVIEPTLADTSFLERTISFMKPVTTPGNYFLIYKLDATDNISEMQENNNTGWLKLHQIQSAILPYTNDFSNSPADWSHGALLGTDEWNWNYEAMRADTININSHSQLYSPIFDLSELVHPVLEFDLNGLYTSGEYTLLYSTNGGKSWEQLEHSSVVSKKRMYNPTIYASIVGRDFPGTGLTNSHLLGFETKQLISTGTYRGRDYDDDLRFVYDLQFLQGQKVQFMFDHANLQNLLPLTIDNFSVAEAQTDLYIPNNKKLLATSSDAKINTYFFVKNNANYMAMPSLLELYCSVDSVYDASDVLVQTQQLDTILPYKKRLVHVFTDTPVSYGNYNYLLYKIVQSQAINESNTLNNSGGFPLAMDSASHFNYPLVIDFNSAEIDGWSWRSDSSSNISNHRFRHLTVTGEPTPGAQDGQWFLDPIDQLNFSNSVSGYSINHLESPAFDFSSLGQVQLTFDFLCVGVPFGNTQGGNLSYSVDGGVNWIVLSYNQDPNAINWYDSPSISTLNGEPGWGDFDQWSTAGYNLSFLGGQPNVRFRFKYKAEFAPYAGAIQGFRMDNFAILASPLDLVAQNMPDITANSSSQHFDLTYHITNISANDLSGTITKFYWSTDPILDNNDQLLYEFPEPSINPGGYDNQIAVYFPHPVTQQIYYLIFKGDSYNGINETNEQNNTGRVKVIFDPFVPENIDLEAVVTVSEIQDDLTDHFFPFSFQYINNGNFYSEPSEVKFYWSDDTLLNIDDIILYSIEEPVLNGGIFNAHSGDLYYPIPVTQQDYYLFIEADAGQSNAESDESNNLTMIHVLFDLSEMSINEIQDSGIQLLSTEESLVFFLPVSCTGNFEYSLYNTTGQLIDSGNKIIDAEKLTLKKPDLSTGMYFIKAIVGNQLINFQFIEP